MTPMAHAIAKQTTLPTKKRKPVWLADTKTWGDHAELMNDIHCFECSEVFDIACEMTDSEQARKVSDELIFLPAPRTWVEHKDGKGRVGWLLTEDPLTFRLVREIDDQYIVKDFTRVEGMGEEERFAMTGLLISMLALINSPHVIGRTEFPAHRGLQRLWQRRVRKEPLHAWHELKLLVSKPIDIDDGEPHSAQIGGRRALHFCRAHLRIRLGQLEFVTSHWRGDPALGTKLTRYRVA